MTTLLQWTLLFVGAVTICVGFLSLFLALGFTYWLDKNNRGEPEFCQICYDENLKTEVIGYDGGHLSEYQMVCKNCGNICGYWAYGYWEPRV